MHGWLPTQEFLHWHSGILTLATMVSISSMPCLCMLTAQQHDSSFTFLPKFIGNNALRETIGGRAPPTKIQQHISSNTWMLEWTHMTWIRTSTQDVHCTNNVSAPMDCWCHQNSMHTPEYNRMGQIYERHYLHQMAGCSASPPQMGAWAVVCCKCVVVACSLFRNSLLCNLYSLWNWLAVAWSLHFGQSWKLRWVMVSPQP